MLSCASGQATTGLNALGTKTNYYFVRLESQAEGCSSASNSAEGQPVVPFPNLTLGPLLGKGGYGQVYRGMLDDETLVAVKVRSSVLADPLSDPLQNTPKDCCCKMLFVIVSYSMKLHYISYRLCIDYMIADMKLMQVVNWQCYWLSTCNILGRQLAILYTVNWQYLLDAQLLLLPSLTVLLRLISLDVGGMM